MDFNIQIYLDTAAVKPLWDAQLPANSNLLLHDLECVTNSKIEDVTPFYVTIADAQQKIIGLVYAQSLRFLPKFININTLNSTLMWATKTLLTCKVTKLLVIGHLFRHDAPYMYFAPHISHQQQKHIVQLVIKALEEQVKPKALFLKDMPEHIAASYNAQDTFTRFSKDFGMQMQIPTEWESFKDYEQALKHKYVQRLRKTKKAFVNVTIKELSLQDIEAQKNEIYNLYLQVCKNQNITLGLLNPNYFVEFKKSLDGQLVVHGFYFENKLVAFSSAISKHHVFDMNYIGFDYSINNQLQLYFNMLFYFVEQAIERKCTTLYLGRTALEAKAILGCTPIKLYGYYKINNGILRRMAHWFSNKESTEQGDLWQSRHPFKSEYYEK